MKHIFLNYVKKKNGQCFYGTFSCFSFSWGLLVSWGLTDQNPAVCCLKVCTLLCVEDLSFSVLKCQMFDIPECQPLESLLRGYWLLLQSIQSSIDACVVVRLILATFQGEIWTKDQLRAHALSNGENEIEMLLLPSAFVTPAGRFTNAFCCFVLVNSLLYGLL